MLVPPENYSMVEDGIYRCSKLDAINISFLKSLELKSIVWINEEKPPRVLQQFIEDQKINLFHMMNSSVLPEEDEITNVKYQEWMVLKPSIISKSIKTILNTGNQNCLLMDKSEVIVGVLRHIQRWNYSSISNEYRLYASRASYKVEIFLELINLELVPHVEDDSAIDGIQESMNSVILEEKEKNFGIPLVTNENYNNSNSNYGVTNIGNHSLTKAISIKRNSADGNIKNDYIDGAKNNYGQIATSPAIRRLSIEHNGVISESGEYSSPLSSSVGRLSISTSPQIPKNLLKLVEMRKNKKKHIQEVKEQDDTNVSKEDRSEQLESSPGVVDAGIVADVTDATVSTDAATVTPICIPISHESSSPIKGDMLPNPPISPVPVAQWKLYLPRADSVLVSRPSHHGQGKSPRPLQTSITVRLPPEEFLPSWFVELRALCETQCGGIDPPSTEHSAALGTL